MRHRKSKITLDRSSSARKGLFRNLATSLVLYEKIRTTEAKAHAIRPIVERLITIGKEPTLAHRRALGRTLTTDGAVKKVLEVLGPRYASRRGGYTRIIKLGRREGDRAALAHIEFV